MKFEVTMVDLEQLFPQLTWHPSVQQVLPELDWGHMQLLRDCYRHWQINCEAFWAMMLCLVVETNRGSLCLNLKQADIAYPNLSMNWNKAKACVQTRSIDDFSLASSQVLALVDDRLYWVKNHALEGLLNEQIQRLTVPNRTPQWPDHDIKTCLKQVVASLKYQLTAEQQIALANALIMPFSIISGGPGTGKTTIMGSVLRALVALGVHPDDMALCAPTGRAAFRMTESLAKGLSQDLNTGLDMAEQMLAGLEALTIHRLLGVRKGKAKPLYHADNTLNIRLLVVDEVSMVDMSLMTQLLAAIPDDCRVVFLGDQFQLPSVRAGAILADLMPAVDQPCFTAVHQQHLATLLDQSLEPSRIHKTPEGLLVNAVTILTDSQRCQADIAAISALIRLGDAPAFMTHKTMQKVSLNDPFPTTGFCWVDHNLTDSEWPQHLKTWLKQHLIEAHDFIAQAQSLKGFDPNGLSEHHNTLNALFQAINGNRILSLVNHGRTGAVFLNQIACDLMKRALSETGVGHEFHGAVIMINQNDHSLKLFNGDVALLLKSQSGHLRAVFERGGQFMSYAVHVIPDFSPAFAITVHKSQGSEFSHVMMPLPEDVNHRLLSREIIYTGITRAKSSVQLIGTHAALEQGINHQNQRQSGLKFWS